HLVAPCSRRREGLARNAFDFAHSVNTEVAGFGRALRLLAEIGAASELAEHQHVHALDDLALQRRMIQQGLVHERRANVRIEPERLANAEQALLRAFGGRIPFRSAHGAQEHRVRRAARSQSLTWQWLAGLIDSDAANVARGECEIMAKAFADSLQRQSRLRGHLGADAIAWQQDDAVIAHMARSRS